MNKKTFALFILRERSLAILYLIFALINDWVNSKVERLWTHLIVESLLKLLILLDICGYSGFYCIFRNINNIDNTVNINNNINNERNNLIN